MKDMGKILILGGGTAGTMMANHLDGKLDHKNWSVTVVDQRDLHYYQPGFLFVPFGLYSKEDIVKPMRKFLPGGVQYLNAGVELIEPKNNRVRLQDGKTLQYDYLIVATGSRTVPEETEGLLGSGWRRNIFDFYSADGCVALYEFLKTWKGGRLIVHIKEMPIKCPVAPLEFAFLADSFFAKRGMRTGVEITYVTPLSGAFTKPIASKVLGSLLERKKIHLIPDFDIEKVDAEENKIVSYGGVEVPYDLLVTVPTNMGDGLVEHSGLGDELNFIPTDPKTLRSKNHENIFAIGDAANVPASKAGSVAHFEADVLTENVLRSIQGKPLLGDFDGHTNCFIESGHDKAFLIDFDYDTEPLTGKFPLPWIGPLSLLKETRMNHWGKLAFRWIYWNFLVKGRPLPFISNRFSMVGKTKV
jgi:sulfide:quinone oxidoreductase